MSEVPNPSATVHPGLFRRVLGSVPAPVSVVTSADEQGPHGTTVSAFCSLSLEPPMILVALDLDSDLLSLIQRVGRWGVNVLARGQEGLAERFARKGADKFADVPWHDERGLPRLPSAQAWLACVTSELIPGGDHAIATGHVASADCRDAEPLVYHERTFWALAERLR